MLSVKFCIEYVREPGDLVDIGEFENETLNGVPAAGVVYSGVVSLGVSVIVDSGDTVLGGISMCRGGELRPKNSPGGKYDDGTAYALP